jgi:hypothetical protein
MLVEMPPGFVEIEFEPDDGDDGTGRLHVGAVGDDYSGRATAWFARASLEDFAQKLGAFPLSLDAPVEVAGGFVDQEQVGIRVAPVGSKGQISVTVHLATPRWPDTRPEAMHEVRLELFTTYQQLARFSHELAAVLRGLQPVARLETEHLR